MDKRIINVPLSEDDVLTLRAGDYIYLSGTVFTARDVAHKRMDEMLNAGQPLPFDINGAVIYYMGPSPARPGRVIGSAGPTTAGRMDSFTPRLIELGLRGMIGKGVRSAEVKAACVKNKAVYFAAIGGAGALLSRCIKSSEVIAFDDLGTEAIRKLEIEQMPAVVVNDAFGGDRYEER